MCWAAESDEVHVDAGVRLVEERQHQFVVLAAILWDPNGAAGNGSSLEVSESAQEMIDKRHDGSEVT